jgi:two-component system response regulator RpaA
MDMSTTLYSRLDLLTTGVTARVCGVAPRTVSKWCDSGALPNYRIPGGSQDRRIQFDDLRRFMLAHGIPTEALDGCRGRVLLVSQDHRLAATLRGLLPAGWTVDAAGCWFEAGTFVQKHLPTAIVVDLLMGRDLAQRARVWLDAKVGTPPASVALAAEDDPVASDFAARGWVVLRQPWDVRALAEAALQPTGQAKRHRQRSTRAGNLKQGDNHAPVT